MNLSRTYITSPKMRVNLLQQRWS